MSKRGSFEGFRIRFNSLHKKWVINDKNAGVWSVDYPSYEEAMRVASFSKSGSDFMIKDALIDEIVYDSRDHHIESRFEILDL